MEKRDSKYTLFVIVCALVLVAVVYTIMFVLVKWALGVFGVVITPIQFIAVLILLGFLGQFLRRK